MLFAFTWSNTSNNGILNIFYLCLLHILHFYSLSLSLVIREQFRKIKGQTFNQSTHKRLQYNHKPMLSLSLSLMFLLRYASHMHTYMHSTYGLHKQVLTQCILGKSIHKYWDKGLNSQKTKKVKNNKKQNIIRETKYVVLNV